MAMSNFRTTTQKDHVARFDLAVLALPMSSAPATVASEVSALKARNPSLQVAQVTNINQVADNSPLATQVSASKWWLRTAHRKRVAWRRVPGVFDVNFKAFTALDAKGKRYPQVKAGVDSSTFFKASPAIDHVFANWVSPQPVDADWKVVGSNQAWTDSSVQAAQRSGHAAYWGALRVLHPNLKVIANLAPAWQSHGLLLIKSAPTAADTRPPTPPSNLVASGLSCNAVTLAWAAATDNTAVTAYDVYHDGQLMTSVGANTRSTALTLTPGATWGLYVNARDAAGNVSQTSPILSIRIPLCQTDSAAPSVPTGLRGSLSGTTASLNWNASTDNVGVTANDVFRNNAKVGSTAALFFSDSGLVPNSTFQFSVAARDAAGNTSARSLGLSLTTGAACANVVCAVTEVAPETDIPWGLAALPDVSVLYSRRDVLDIVRLNPITGVKTSLGTLPDAQGTNGEGGMLGIAVSPGFPAADPWLYAFYTTAVDNRIVRVQYRNGALDLSTLKVLLSGIGRNAHHKGGRLRYGPDGKLYAATGDAQNTSSAQSVNTLTGKILRLNPDGSVPADNPFGNLVWSYGHRNPQGLAFDAQGRLWQQEFGNSVMDETNLVQRGGNYGWPTCEGTSSRSGTGCATPGFIAPKLTYPTSEGSCSGIAVVRDALYVACQRGERVYRAVISGADLTGVQQLFVGTYGRIRTVEPSIDGGLWMSTTNGGDKDSIANNSSNKIFKVTLGN